MINKQNMIDIAEQYGTPTYVYDGDAISERYLAFGKNLTVPHLICYAVKANSNIALLQLLAKLGSGFDIVSQGELERCLHAGADPEKIVFSGVAKSHKEIKVALQAGIGSFNIESLPELERINQIAKSMDKTANIALRVNPDVNVKTHPYIATGLKEHKFGIALEHVSAIIKRLESYKHVKLKGIACHIGSQLNELGPYQDALQRLLNLASDIDLEFIDLGGGMGISYESEDPLNIERFCEMLNTSLKDKSLKLILEPGRCIVGPAGVLLTKVEYIKEQNGKRFAIIDAGMNDLPRPSLYNAWHDIVPVNKRNEPTQNYDVVGPVCESADVLGKQRKLSIQAGDLLTICDAGAYSQCMSSNYNSRPKCCEVLLLDGKSHEIRRRETISDLFAHEKLL
jgi:diaminopimelate decarboxylase